MKKILISIVVIFLLIFFFFYIICLKDSVSQKESNDNLNETVLNAIVEKEMNQTSKDYEDLNDAMARSTTDLNFRDEPSKDGDIILVIPKDDVFDLKARYNNGWYKIIYNQKERLCIRRIH